MQETIVTGRKFRKLVDKATSSWQRISFWTKASDVEFNDGANAQSKVGSFKGLTSTFTSSTATGYAADAKGVYTAIEAAKKSLQTSFQDGVDSIYDAINGLGTTPAGKSLAQIVAAINQLAKDQKQEGIDSVKMGTTQQKTGAITGSSDGFSITLTGNTLKNLLFVAWIYNNSSSGPDEMATANLTLKDTSGGTFKKVLSTGNGYGSGLLVVYYITNCSSTVKMTLTDTSGRQSGSYYIYG